MAGNVWEWTSSLFKPYPYVPTDDREAEKSKERRVMRGGSRFVNGRLARAAYRLDALPGEVMDFPGFRLARSVP
jgi:formylglycine-generating enzyme required for sulfatase activity